MRRDRASAPTASFIHDPDTLALREAECWADALHCIGYSYDYLLSSNLSDASLRGYRVLLLPAAWCLSDPQCRAIEKFVREGGVLLATSAPGERDELGRLRPSWTLGRLLGVDKPQYRPITPVAGTPLGIVQPEGWWEMDGLRQAEGDLTYANRLCCAYTPMLPESPDFRILHRFSDGQPAVIQRRMGRGGCS